MPRKKSAPRDRSATAMLSDIKTSVDDPVLLERRRRQITAAAIHAFRKLGFHPATIRDVAKRAKVSVGLIYQYVGDKEDLLLMALVEGLRCYEIGIPKAIEREPHPLNRFWIAVSTYCRVQGSPAYATVLAYRNTACLRKERRDLIKQLETNTNELLGKCIRDCIDGGLFKPETDDDLFTYQLVMFCHTWTLKAWYFAPRMSLDEYLERGLSLNLRAVVTPKGARELRRIGRWRTEGDAATQALQ